MGFPTRHGRRLKPLRMFAWATPRCPQRPRSTCAPAAGEWARCLATRGTCNRTLRTVRGERRHNAPGHFWRVVLLRAEFVYGVNKPTLSMAISAGSANQDSVALATPDVVSLGLRADHGPSTIIDSLRALQVADSDGVRDLLTDTVVVEDHRLRPGAEFNDGESLLAALAAFGLREFKVRLLAIRGDSLALVRLRFERQDRPISDTLVVAECNAQAQLTLILVYDTTDVVGALGAMAGLYRTTLPAVSVPVFDACTAFTHAAGSRNFDAMSALSSPGLVSLDHREGMQSTARREVTLKVLEGVLADDLSVVDIVPEIHALMEWGTVASRAECTLEGLGLSEIEIALVGIQDGLVSRIELFDPDGLEAALVQLQSLSEPALWGEDLAWRHPVNVGAREHNTAR